MAEARLTIVVKDKSEAGEEAYRAVLEALRAQALRAADALKALVGRHTETLLEAFPGPTVSNTLPANIYETLSSPTLRVQGEEVIDRDEHDEAGDSGRAGAQGRRAKRDGP
jgi:hypothetical protein